MDSRLTTPFRVLRYALGLAATLAGLDKFFNILADWGAYVSPAAAHLLPVPVGTFMALRVATSAAPPRTHVITA